MSYCRFIVADVYVFHNVSGHLTCYGCSMRGRHEHRDDDFNCTLRSEMVEHLKAHVRNGDHVPEFVFERLRHEIETIGDSVEGG